MVESGYFYQPKPPPKGDQRAAVNTPDGWIVFAPLENRELLTHQFRFRHGGKTAGKSNTFPSHSDTCDRLRNAQTNTYLEGHRRVYRIVPRCFRCPVGNPIRYQGQHSAAMATLLPFISRNSITDVFSEFRAKQTREHRELDAMKFERAVRRLVPLCPTHRPPGTALSLLQWCTVTVSSSLFAPRFLLSCRAHGGDRRLSCRRRGVV